MSAFLPSSALGLPASLDFKLPPSLSDDSKAYHVSISPDSITSVVSPTVTFTAAAGTSLINPFNSQLLTWTLPSGTSRDLFLDPKETFLTFRMRINLAVAANGGTPAGNLHQLIGSAQSFFDSLILYSNNIPIEQINGYNLLAHQLLNATVNSAERYGGCAVALGCDTDSATGVNLAITAAGDTFYSFSIPLISIIGINGRDHLFPIGSISNLQLQMQTATNLPFATYCTAPYANQASGTVTLDQFSLNMKYVSIGQQSAALLYSTLPDGKYFMKTQTWVQSSANIPANTGGTVNLAYQIRNSSLKSMIIQNSTSGAVALCPNGLYDAVNLSVTQFNINVGGLNYPQTPLNPTQRPSQAFLHYMSALGMNGDYKKIGGLLTRSAYGATMTGGIIGQSDSMMVVPALGVRANSSIDAATNPVILYPNQSYLGCDFEKSGGILFNGVSTRSAPPVGNYFLGANTPAGVNFTSFAFGLVDCVVIVDPMSQTISAYV